MNAEVGHGTFAGGVVPSEHDDFVRPFDFLGAVTSACSVTANAYLLEQQRMALAHANFTWRQPAVFVFACPSETAFVTEQTPAVTLVDDLSDPATTIESMYQFSGLTYEQIAGALRVSRQSLNNWRRGEPVSDVNRKRIATLDRAIRSATAAVAFPLRHQHLLAADPSHPGRSRLATLAVMLDEEVPASANRLRRKSVNSGRPL